MNKIIPIAVIIVIVALIIGVVAFTQNNQPAMGTNSSNMSNMSNMNTTSSTNGLQSIIIIQNGTVSPANLTIKPNTTVVWTVKDPTGKYMITSKSKNQGMYLFMSNDLSNGQSFSFKFIGNGTYSYYDMDHMGNSNLTGTIIVQ